MLPAVSVIIPCYRCADTVGRAVASVIEQSVSADEIVLVEDCSDDGGATLKVLHYLKEMYPNNLIIVLALNRNCGPGAARNAGWAIAKGTFLAFLDADDSWHPSKLEIQLGWMLTHPEAMMTGAQTEQIRDNASVMQAHAAHRVTVVTRRMLLLSNCFPTRTVVLRREIGFRFDPVKRYAEDYLLWLQIVLAGFPTYTLHVPLAYSYKADYGGVGLTGSLWKMQVGELDTYWRIRRVGLISAATLMLLMGFSLAKFCRRVLVSYCHRWIARPNKMSL